MTTSDPLKHLQGYGRRHPETGMLHSHIRYPDGQPPVPFGCRWCGTDPGGHGRRWEVGPGVHGWVRPTEAQILARMRARRAARLNATPAKYHATTGWSPEYDGESAEPYCLDCGTTACRRWERISNRLQLKHLGLRRWPRKPRGAGGWSTDWPF